MIQKATAKEYDDLITIWERSVRATHHFLPETYLQQIKNLLPEIFKAVPVLIYRHESGEIAGFLGVVDHKLEMLFIDPAYMGKGIGRKLMRYAIDELKATKVDVNEHNAAATAFYQHIGFVVVSRSELDGMGKPFPLLHMELRG